MQIIRILSYILSKSNRLDEKKEMLRNKLTSKAKRFNEWIRNKAIFI
jgi:hypothetical protein